MKQDLSRYKTELVDVLITISDYRDLFSAFIEDILTPAEFDEIVLRWQIIKQLQAGTPQRTIAENLGVGIATVTRGSRSLHSKKRGFTRAWIRSEKK